MSTEDKQQVTIRLRCIELPGREIDGRSNVSLGIQKGKQVIEDQAADAAEIVFECPLRVEKNSESGKPNFLGPYAQGTPKERFIYLCWGERKAGAWDGFGRVKVHLKEITWSAVEQALTAAKPLEATVKLTNSKGQPIYASVGKEYITWHLE